MAGIGKKICLGGGGGEGGRVCKKEKLVQFAILKTRGKLERIRFRKDFWDRYWGRAVQLLAKSFTLFPGLCES